MPFVVDPSSTSDRSTRASAPAPAEDASLPVGQIVGAVLLGRLKDPKVLGAIGLLVAFLAAVKLRRNR